ncbi:MAG: TIGR01777 family oxidoreductase [Myxococcota bacterium]
MPTPESETAARHAEAGTVEPWRVAISGASGMVGQALAGFLRAGGHTVVPLVRGGGEGIAWDPRAEKLDPASLIGVDAVVHLAGEPISGRWSDEKKRRIVESRELGTRLVASAMAKALPGGGPRVLVSASAIGFYGDRGDAPVDEDSAAGDGFLAEVCQAWEDATEAAQRAGIRTVCVRIGVVLDPAGGALAQMLTPFKAGVGGPVGGGDQVMSWIGLGDLVAILHRAIWDDGLSGPVNAVTPHAVTNRQFAKTLGRVLRRPAFLPLPAAVVRGLFGEMGQSLLLDGARVLPRRLEQRGHRFAHPELEGALRDALGRASS